MRRFHLILNLLVLITLNLSVQMPRIARQECCALGPAIGTGNGVKLVEAGALSW